ncbi:beta strand repeat-containing protein [Sphingomonas sp.]|uniref:beta strand repeat-containing protein n=1 Tax=Sphingomonas sp. TaxID=28214 RepID=UPI003B0018DE
MAGYVFENMSDQDAAAFGDGDTLLFRSATANQVNVQPYSNGSSGANVNSGITLSFGGISHTFNASISTASQMGNIVFNDASHLVIGTQAGAETLTLQGNVGATGSGTAGMNVDPNTVYALGGADTINASMSAAGVSNYLNGGFGADTIMGGNANNHIYGNSQFSQVGDVDPGNRTPDAGDTITVGSGTNYINGNAGTDTITVGSNATAPTTSPGGNTTPGTAASTGDNRVFGGADADTITIRGAGLNQVNGNTGNDTITASTAVGDNTLRGGMGDDSITAGHGHDVVMGDVGNDTLIVSGETTGATAGTASNTHITQLTGSQGSDTFDFSAAGAGIASTFAGSSTSGGTAGQTYYQTITDFSVADADRLSLTTTTPSGQTPQVAHSATVFTSVHDAEIFAQTQLNPPSGNAAQVSVLNVGSANNAYVFYNDANGGDPTSGNDAAQGLGIIHLTGVDANSISNPSFQGF